MKTIEQKIKEVQEGKAAIKNDSTLEELTKVLKLIFSSSNDPIGSNTYYYNNLTYMYNGRYYQGCEHLPPNTIIYSVKEFLKPELKRGDLVWVSDTSHNPCDGYKRIFLAYIEGANYPYVTVAKDDNELFHDNKPFIMSNWKYATKVGDAKETIMTIAEIEKALGVSNLKIIK